MNGFFREIKLVALFIFLSVVIYYIHYLIFADMGLIWDWVVASLGFLPISIYLVSVVVERLLTRREKVTRMRKLNMIIGAFYGQVGTSILKIFARMDKSSPEIQKRINAYSGARIDFLQVKQDLANYQPTLEIQYRDLAELKEVLSDKNATLLRLLENPILLEHESFADLLWAVFHLYQELDNRLNLHLLPDTDLNHLAADIKRAARYTITQWLMYMNHLQEDYPYLYSLAIRTNPFDTDAVPEVQ